MRNYLPQKMHGDLAVDWCSTVLCAGRDNKLRNSRVQYLQYDCVVL